MHLIAIILLYLVGLSGSKDFFGKKRAYLLSARYNNKLGFVNR